MNVLLNKEKLIIILKLFKNKFITNFFYYFSNNYTNRLYLRFLTYLYNNNILGIYSENVIKIHKRVQKVLSYKKNQQKKTA